MAFEDLLTIVPLDIVLTVFAGYLFYISTFHKQDGNLFKSLDKKTFARSAAIGLTIFFIVFSWYILDTNSRNDFDFCKTQENGCLEVIQYIALIISVLLFIVSFALFIARYSESLVVTWLVAVFILSLFFLLTTAVPLESGGSWREQLLLEKNGNAYIVTFFISNLNPYEQLLNRIQLVCQGTPISFDSKTCHGNIPATLGSGLINKVSCPITDIQQLDDCREITYVINGFWTQDRNVLDSNLWINLQ